MEPAHFIKPYVFNTLEMPNSGLLGTPSGLFPSGSAFKKSSHFHVSNAL
jgi:hypothetical protein